MNGTYNGLTTDLELMKDADSLGAIMKFDLSEEMQFAIRQMLEYWHTQSFIPEQVEKIIPAMDLILALTEKYSALVMNPPYMGSGNMNATLSDYVKQNYEIGKADLFSTFMLLAIDRLADNGKYGMINMHSWMFLSSFEKLRRSLLDNYHIDSLLHLGPRTFDELNGEVVQNAAFVITNGNSQRNGTYYRLVDGRNCADKESLFLNSKTIPKIYYANVEQHDFEKIPGCPLGYWVSEKTRNTFVNPQLDEIADIVIGIKTGDNDLFLKRWFEINYTTIGFGLKNLTEINSSNKKWFPYVKGGDYRKWYGNQELVINWEESGNNMLNHINKGGIKDARIRQSNFNLYGREFITWSRIASANLGVRYVPTGLFFDCNSPSIFQKEERLNYILALLVSKVSKSLMQFIAPTLSFQIQDIKAIPYITTKTDDIREISVYNKIESFVEQNISISKLDWDAHETSWDFDTNPLVALRNNSADNGDSSFKLSSLVEQFESIWEENFNKLHANEEELNRQFIDIYGLQDELSPEVPKNEITILQQGEISLIQTLDNDNDYILRWNEDVLMKQLISYAVGVWMGRYKLGTKGLHIAHPDPTDKELQEYGYGGAQVYIDEDGLIPVLPQSSPFDDNLSSRISDFVRIAFGEEKLTENLNYIEQKLGTSIDLYVQKDFWKDHKRMYQNRPVYWLFSSKKGAFRCLAYMHRMNAYTAERVRSNYLLPYIEFLQNQIGELENRASTLSTTENRKLQNFQKALEECREYHERLQVVAEQAIAFDLDDGVVVNYAKFGDVLAKLK